MMALWLTLTVHVYESLRRRAAIRVTRTLSVATSIATSCLLSRRLTRALPNHEFANKNRTATHYVAKRSMANKLQLLVITQLYRSQIMSKGVTCQTTIEMMWCQ